MTSAAMAALAAAALDHGVAIALCAALQLVLVGACFEHRRRRLRAEKLLAETQARLSLISSMRDLGFWSWDATSDRVWASTQARTILVLDEDIPLTLETLLSAIHPDDRVGVLKAFSATGRASDTMQMEFRVVGSGGEIRGITVKAYIHSSAKGAVETAVGYVLEDCQRKNAAAELLKLRQRLAHQARVVQLGELSGAIAHELQQPLTAILCNAQAGQLLIANENVDVQDLRDILDDIVNDDKYAGQIIQRLRALFIRGETQFRGMEIGCLIDAVLTLARGTLMERNVQVNTRIDEGIRGIQGDPVEIQQVLLNLILNACESMSANPARDRRVEIVVGQKDDAVCTSVLDCGTGIARDQLESVFDPFFTTKAGGMGLGLAICHSIITAHGGRLWVTNRAERGAAFHFTLPVIAREKSNGISTAHSVHC
jgi:C4-dicarboxylate-specific signal transduction histidine kinase